LRDLPGEHTLAELADLLYGAYTPVTAWAAWWWLADGLYFRGSPEALVACSLAEVQSEHAARQAKADEARLWLDFLERARLGKITSQDRPFLRDVEDLAMGRRDHSRVLRDLGRSETPQAAHALLLDAGVWDAQVNPHPVRLGISLPIPGQDRLAGLTLPQLPDETRLDLTHLPAFAIDDPGNQDPDDAISLDGERIWVHVADVAALVPPDSPLDLEARSRAATLYLPEGSIPMLPPELLPQLGLGLAEISPALSFGLRLAPDGSLDEIEIRPSWVRAQRLTYDQAELRLDEEPFRELYRLTMRYQERRRAAGATFIDLPEVKIHVAAGTVEVFPIQSLRIRECVQEAMLMAGEAAARYALAHQLAVPFAYQDAPDPRLRAEILAGNPWRILNLSEMYALRRLQRPGQAGVQPGRHAGLGLDAYARATSPLRRYLDLVVHQQLRLHLSGQPSLDTQDILERVGTSAAVIGSLNQAETLSERHWTLVYLLQHPGWQGEAVLVDKKGLRGKFILPALALEAQVHLRRDLPLDSRVLLAVKEVNLAELEGYFQVVGV
jgi:exoribonuclease-2